MTGSTPPEATIENKSKISPIWIVPLIALAIGGWLLFKSISEAGSRITIHFATANGIVEGKTPIRFQGLVIGTVQKISFSEKLSGVDVSAEIDFRAKHLLRENTRFWLVSPKATVTGISGLDTLVQGNYIAMLPGDGDATTYFTADTGVPHYLPQEGLLVRLIATDMGSLNVGSSVYYKKIKVGEIHNFSLTDDGRHVIIDAIIEDAHANLVKRSSRFWNVSGISARLNQKGFSLQVDSLASMLSGGISFDSPPSAPAAENDSFFDLYPDQAHAERGIQLQLTASLDAGIAAGTEIVYQHQPIGQVTEITPEFDQQRLVAKAQILPELEPLLTEQSRLQLIKPTISLGDPASLKSVLSGVRLELQPAPGAPTTRFTVIGPTEPVPGQLIVRLFADSAKGIQPGSGIWYRGVNIGQVTDISLDSERDRAELSVAINHAHRSLVGANSRFYVYNPVSFNAGLQGVSLETGPLASALDGAIALYNPGQATGTLRPHYRLYSSLEQAKLADETDSAPFRVRLTADALNSVSVGSPVYYHKLQVGSVADFTLQDNQRIAISLDIAAKYRQLVTQNSVFWSVSGIRADASTAGISLEMDTLTAIAAGGIAFDNLDNHTSRQPYRLYASHQEAIDRPTYITLTFIDGQGMKAGAPIRFRGVDIGRIDQIWLSYDLSKVQARARINQRYADHFARQDARFWIEQADISLNGASNLGTLISGPFIAALPGIGAPTDRIAALTEVPSEIAPESLQLVLTHPSRASLRPGSPVHFRQIEVGQVDRVHLSEDSAKVLIDIHIEPPFTNLVRQNTVFWAHSGVNVEFGFAGAKIQTESVESVLKGGIAFNTPDQQPAAKATQGARFTLHDAPEDSWLQWHAALPR